VERYLKTPCIKEKFEALYNDRCEEQKVKKNKRRLNRQTRLISQSEVMLEDRSRLLELERQLSNTEMAEIEIRNIKEILFNHAKELHRLYQGATIYQLSNWKQCLKVYLVS
jgi:fido (protein-threonine AMPylation protein)